MLLYGKHHTFYMKWHCVSSKHTEKKNCHASNKQQLKKQKI